MDATTTRGVILELLRQAAAAHGAYEADELGGVYDERWPEWYAAHMSEALAAQGYRLAESPDSHGRHDTDPHRTGSSS